MQYPNYSQCFNEFCENRSYMRFSKCKNYVLFDYKEMVEYDNLWNDINVWCRGIVFDANTKEVVCVPFRKFWNLNQKPETQLEILEQKSGTPKIFSKMDGSMLLVFFDQYSGKLKCCTRGSFESPQAEWAQNWIDSNIKDLTPFIQKDWTHIFEVIYKDNRIVVPYDFEGLVYLHSTKKMPGSIENLVMYTQNLEWFSTEPYRITPQFSFQKIGDYIEKSLSIPFTEEGWVLYYDDQTMVKIKGKDYLRVHRLRSEFTEKHIKELLIAHNSLKDIVSMFPDEFLTDVEGAVGPLLDKAMKAAQNASYEASRASQLDPDSRKEQAQFLKKQLSGYCLSAAFAYLDNQPERAWTIIIKGL